MGFARRHAAELRKEARQLRAMGLKTLADDREKQSEIFERIADEAQAERDADDAR